MRQHSKAFDGCILGEALAGLLGVDTAYARQCTVLICQTSPVMPAKALGNRSSTPFSRNSAFPNPVCQ